MTANWTTMIANERMQLDQEFEPRIEQSSFNRQQWGLVMTAVDMKIENASDPASAKMVPDTSSLPSMLTEIEKAGSRGPMGASGPDENSGDGLFSSIWRSLGFGGENGSDPENLEEATELATEYCERLQEDLEERGRWADICQQAQQ